MSLSPLRGRRPALLALLLALAASRGSQECRLRAVAAGASLCLAPEEFPREWLELRWKKKEDEKSQFVIATATGDGNVTNFPGPFHGRAQFQPGILSLCIAPVHRDDGGVYEAEFENSSGNFPLFPRCFRVSVWDPIPEPSLESQILEWDQGWCRLSLLCSSPGNGNVSITWECPEDLPGSQKSPEFPKSELTLRIPDDAEPRICLCNLSNAAGWSAASAPLTCAGIPGNFWLWAALGAGLLLLLALLGLCWRRRRRRRKENTREDPPGAAAGPPEPPLTVYAEVGAGKPRRDPPGTSEATQEGATIYAVVTPRTLEHPRNHKELGNFTIYSTLQSPSSMKRKRLDRALVSTAYLEDNGGYRHLDFPNSKRP